MGKRPNTPRRYPLPDGSDLTCPICKKAEFWYRKTLLNTPGMTFLGWEFVNREAFNLVCDHCSHMLWFHDLPKVPRA